MTLERQIEISKSFPDQFFEFEMNISISQNDYDAFLSTKRIGRLGIFDLDNVLHFWRGDICLYKIEISQQNEHITLTKAKAKVLAYPFPDTDEKSKIFILKHIQSGLNRQDLYVHPAYEFEIVKRIIREYDPNNKCITSIGHGDNIGLMISIRDMSDSDKRFYTITGWTQLRQELVKRDPQETLLQLYLQNNEKGTSDTFYFDRDETQVLGHIHTEKSCSTNMQKGV